VTSNARKAPNTVRCPLKPGSSSSLDQLPDPFDTRESEGVSVVFVVVERHSVELATETAFSWTVIRFTEGCSDSTEQGSWNGWCEGNSVWHTNYSSRLIPLTPIDLDTWSESCPTHSKLRLGRTLPDVFGHTDTTCMPSILVLVKVKISQQHCPSSPKSAFWLVINANKLMAMTRGLFPDANRPLSAGLRCTTWKPHMLAMVHPRCSVMSLEWH
jgi:hypothetical protein